MSKKRSILIGLEELNINEISEEDLEKCVEVFKKTMAQLNRKPSVPCVCDDCGGRVVKHVRSLFRGQYHFSQPECEDCGAQYGGAEKFDAIALGVEEFERMMRTPFTI